ncbi:proteinase-activated receptor 4-like [Latimeria chalumnae]|uniref:proteinase-activated receptor 4-like n=1 Tax=Latimeria chalumnae TaxID=7897 RepID=UPI0006D8EC58|nr:PREDICTED: proteinase-activated receptor 4-like [Latimeria chalumnae]|eukprot:XP_014350130.1 PREDICTED: proteinase-activated receptor 4-like [Latimeria chalumnae]
MMLVPLIYTVTLIVSLPANGLALWVLCTRIKKVASTIFLINLTIVDLLFTFTLPFKISYHFLGNDWRLGEHACRALVTAYYGNIYCSVLLLMCISIDRYSAIVHPLLSRTLRNKKFAFGACLGVWILIGLAVVPFTLIHQSYPIDVLNITICHDVLPETAPLTSISYYFVCLVAVAFILPFSVIVFCHVSVLRALLTKKRQYRHSVMLTVLVLVTFIVCFTPGNVILLIHNLKPLSEDHDPLYIAYMVCLALSSLNACIDPFIYYYASEEFRSTVKKTLLFCKKEKATDSCEKFSPALLVTHTSMQSKSAD